MLDTVDAEIIRRLNGFIARHDALADVALFVANTNLVKALPFLAMLVMAWFAEPVARSRLIVVRGVLGACIAIALGRLLPVALPFRPRPVHEDSLGLLPIRGLHPEDLGGWSSFPSDHGVLFGALVGLGFALSRPAGWGLLLFAILAIWFERALLGYHYLSDLVAGALIGLGCAALAQRLPAVGAAARFILGQAQARPVIFWFLALLFLIQLADMFNPVRVILGAGRQALRWLGG